MNTPPLNGTEQESWGAERDEIGFREYWRVLVRRRNVSQFPVAAEFSAQMRDAGFDRVSCLTLYGGIVCVHMGVRP